MSRLGPALAFALLLAASCAPLFAVRVVADADLSLDDCGGGVLHATAHLRISALDAGDAQGERLIVEGNLRSCLSTLVTAPCASSAIIQGGSEVATCRIDWEDHCRSIAHGEGGGGLEATAEGGVAPLHYDHAVSSCWTPHECGDGGHRPPRALPPDLLATRAFGPWKQPAVGSARVPNDQIPKLDLAIALFLDLHLLERRDWARHLLAPLGVPDSSEALDLLEDFVPTWGERPGAGPFTAARLAGYDGDPVSLSFDQHLDEAAWIGVRYCELAARLAPLGVDLDRHLEKRRNRLSVTLTNPSRDWSHLLAAQAAFDDACRSDLD
ncbi:MAG: hypothetical protein AAGN66_00620 [Acidobacteriota bacterium]